jgi:hypothetical protein
MTTAHDPWVTTNSRLANARAEAALGFWNPHAYVTAETDEPEREPDPEPEPEAEAEAEAEI